MSGRAERRLLSLRRPVTADRRARHGDLWRELAELVVAGGGHAWRFVSADDPLLHLEFLEFEAAGDPRGNPAVRHLLESLDQEVAVASVEEWLEAR